MVMNIFNCSYLAMNEMDTLYLRSLTYSYFKTKTQRGNKKEIYSLTFLEGSNIKANEAALITPKWHNNCIFIIGQMS